MIIGWVDEYINSKKLAWSRSSIRNELYRLRYHGPAVLEDPKKVYARLSPKMTNYSIKTTFTRLGLFYQFLVDTDKIPAAKNPWRLFLEENALLFKHAYQIERLTVTFDEAKERIMTLEYEHKMASLQMLEGGLRYCELRTFDGVKVLGKGSVPRNVFLRDELKAFRFTGSYTPLYKALVSVGLKPHTLRKLCATEFSRHPKVKDQDICKTFGWSSIETSLKYRQPYADTQLSEMLQTVVSRAKLKPEINIKKIIFEILGKIKERV